MKRFLHILTLTGAIFGITMLTPAVTMAQVDPCAGNADSIYCKNKGQGRNNVEGIIKSIVNVLFWIIGIVSVIMIIIGGINFVTSSGDSQKVTKARNTILYAVVGLVVAILSYAIVNFVIRNI